MILDQPKNKWNILSFRKFNKGLIKKLKISWACFFEETNAWKTMGRRRMNNMPTSIALERLYQKYLKRENPEIA